MVLFYGLLALGTANSVISSSPPSIKRSNHSKKPILTQHSTEKFTPSSNSWIYTKDLQKRFDERYFPYRYIFVPVYLPGKTSAHSHSAATLPVQRYDGENSWMYSRSVRDHICHSTPKIPSSKCYVSHQALTRDRLSTRSSSKTGFFKRSASSKAKLINSSAQTFSTSTIKHRTTNVVIEEEENNENHPRPLTKQRFTVQRATSHNRDTRMCKNNPDDSQSNATSSNSKLARLRSFLFVPSARFPNTSRQPTRISS